MKQTRYFFLLGIMLLAACDEPQTNNYTSTNNIAPYPATNPPPDGKQLFRSYCASCHNPLKDQTGPAMQDVLVRWQGDTAKLYAFIRDPMKSIKTGSKNSYQAQLYKKWGKTMMTANPSLTTKQISAILGYANDWKVSGY